MNVVERLMRSEHGGDSGEDPRGPNRSTSARGDKGPSRESEESQFARLKRTSGST